MLAWFEGSWPGRTVGTPPKDVGGATAIGLSRYRDTRDPRHAGAGFEQAGNGSLMLCIPTALAVHDVQRTMLESMEISAVTQKDPRCTIACASYNEVAAALLGGATPHDAVDAGGAAGYVLDLSTSAAVPKGRSGERCRTRLPVRQGHQAGCHSSIRFPAGSVTQANRPTPSMSALHRPRPLP